MARSERHGSAPKAVVCPNSERKYNVLQGEKRLKRLRQCVWGARVYLLGFNLSSFNFFKYLNLIYKSILLCCNKLYCSYTINYTC